MRSFRHPAIALSLAFCGMLQAQSGGKEVFSVLNIPSSARIAALGGSPVAVLDNDLNLGLFNPALLNREMGRQVALSYLPYMADIGIGYGSYGHHFDSLGLTASASVQYVDASCERLSPLQTRRSTKWNGAENSRGAST